MDEAARPPAPKTPDGAAGHRDRLRARFAKAGPDALADYELLELLLFSFLPRRDVKPIAKALIARFGGVSGVLAAPQDALVEVRGVGETTAAMLKAVHALHLAAAKEEAQARPVISSWAALLSYCKVRLQHEAKEQFRVLFLDAKNQLLSDDLMGEGTVDHAPVYPREIAARALKHAASSVILVHNHPSGDPTPSRADIEMTRVIIDALKPLDIRVHDHVVVGRKGHASFRSLGLI